jgi:hypothetical protein
LEWAVLVALVRELTSMLVLKDNNNRTTELDSEHSVALALDSVEHDCVLTNNLEYFINNSCQFINLFSNQL